MHRLDSQDHLNVIWEALEAYRADLIPEGDEHYDSIWSEVCSAMAFITEDLLGEEIATDDSRSYGSHLNERV